MIVLARWITSTGRLLHCCPRHPELSGWATSGPSHCLISFISSSPRCLPTDSESPWGPSNRLLFRGGRWRIVLSLQRRSSLLGKGREPPASYERWISPKKNDSLDWRFLWNVLKRRGFPEAWTNWMKHCVCTTTFAVLINGRPQGEGFTRKGVLGKGARSHPFYSWRPIRLLSAWNDYVSVVISWDFRPRAGRGIPLL